MPGPNQTAFEIVSVANNDNLRETGGAHNQRGIEFQRHWAVLKLLDLEDSGNPDFLLLFETFQDIAVLDSSLEPTTIEVVQVKKKERTEWSWTSLTNMLEPGAKKRKTKKKDGDPEPQIPTFDTSILGRLLGTVNAFETLQARGRFISDAGCNLVLQDGTNAATSTPVPLTHLKDDHLTTLKATLDELGYKVDLDSIVLEKVTLPSADPSPFVVGIAFQFLSKRSKEHANQAQSLVNALMAKFAPLGSRTETCRSFGDLKKRHGFSRAELLEALRYLDSVPDIKTLADDWLNRLQQEGYPISDLTEVRVAISRFYTERLSGYVLEHGNTFPNSEIESWLKLNSVPGPSLSAWIEQGTTRICEGAPQIPRAHIKGALIVKAIENARAKVQETAEKSTDKVV